MLFADRSPNCDGTCLPIQGPVSVCSDDKCRMHQRFTVGTMLTRSVVDIVSYCFCDIVVSCSLLLFFCFPNGIMLSLFFVVIIPFFLADLAAFVCISDIILSFPFGDIFYISSFGDIILLFYIKDICHAIVCGYCHL